MPIRPMPVTYRCPSCGWSKTTAPKSDALLPGDFFTKCQRCGHSPLDICKASFIAGSLAEISRFFR
ncbi:MAG: hypothetical protein CVU58_03885 [Deltaproteobacteria bacterium HGW-Deltaproteobacteria-16]|nr:MAG: hypothetical protein CVU58_03885 [Deltaproteobacteria bacterium HGW-Deltaproteobacteria-16]